MGDNEKLWERKLKQDFDVQGDVSLRPGVLLFHGFVYNNLMTQGACQVVKRFDL